MLKDVSIVIDDSNRMYLGVLDMGLNDALAAFVGDEPILGLEATTPEGVRMVWDGHSGWRSEAISHRTLETSQFEGRRILCCDSELAGFMGYGRVLASKPSMDGSDDRIVCVFPTLQGAEIESALRPSDVILLSDLVEISAERPNGERLVLDVTNEILALEDEDILQIRDGSSSSLPAAIRSAVSEAMGDEPTELRTRIVASICDYFGATVIETGVDGDLRVPEAVFREALENTTQCRMLHDMQLDRVLAPAG